MNLKLTEAKFNILLYGVLVGLYSFAFLFGNLSTLAVLFLFAILLIAFILQYRNSTKDDLFYLLGGIVLAVVLCLLIPALSLATLSDVLLIIALSLVFLIVRK
jgi:hypothetical protein